MEVDYPAGSIVWVKLEGGRWWPGEVTDDSEGSDVTKSLRKQPLAVVKFFDEDCFHIVKSEQHIYSFDCDKKEEFVKRGKDFKMSGKDNFSLRLKFEADVSKAESLCKPLNKPSATATTTASATTTPVINVLKGTKCASYMKIPPAERFDYGANREERTSYESYVTSHNELGLARIRKQPSTPKAKETPYSCDTCGFQTTRIDNFIRHHKSHSDPYRFHPGVDSDPRFVFDKLSALKSRKKAKDGSRSNKVKRPKKNVNDKSKSKNESSHGSRKRKSEDRNRMFGEGRFTPKKKKNKLSQLNKKPFSNPFEDDEEETENKMEEEEKEEVLTNDDDMDMDPALDDQKPIETTPVEWEEFIKDSSMKGNSPKTTETVVKGEDEEEIEDEEEEDAEIKKKLSDDDEDEADYEFLTKDNAPVQPEVTVPPKVQEEVKSENRIAEKEVDIKEIEREELEQKTNKPEKEANEDKEDNDAETKVDERNGIKDDVGEEEEEEQEVVVEKVEEEENTQDMEEIVKVPVEDDNKTVKIATTNGNDKPEEKNEEVIVETKEIPIEEDDQQPNSPATSSNTTPLEVSDPVEEEGEEVEVGLPETLLALSDDMQGGDILVDETEMSTEEIVVTEGSLHAGEIMVGEEIEVQEIEIQSDGMSGGEIVIGDEVVMQLLPEDGSESAGILDPMVPHSNTESMTSNVVLEGDPETHALMNPTIFTSDHSLMAATPMSKQMRANSNAGIYLQQTSKSNESVYASHPYSSGQVGEIESRASNNETSSAGIIQQVEGECSKGGVS